MTQSTTETIRPMLRSVYDCWLLFTVAGSAPLLIEQANFLSQRPHFQFFPIAVLAFIYLAYKLAGLASPLTRGRVYFANFLFGLGLCANTIAAIFLSPWLAYGAMIVTCYAWLLVRYGNHPWTQLLSWCSLLLITLPPPRNLDERLIQQLQQISTQAASRLLDVVGVPHGIAANIIETRTEQLFVDQACSGIDSLYALAAIALLLIVFQRRSFLIAAMTLLCVPLWAVIGNLFRIFLIVYLLDAYNIDLSRGWQHTVLGTCLFALCSIGLLSTVSCFASLCTPFLVGSATEGSSQGVFNSIVCWPAKNPLSKSAHVAAKKEPESSSTYRPAWSLMGLAIQFVLMMILALSSAKQLLSRVSLDATQQLASINPISKSEVASRLTESLMPETWMGMKRTGFRIQHREVSSAYGEHSATWSYMDGAQVIQVSADFPFLGDHQLDFCYELIGNKVRKPIPATITPAFNQEKTLTVRELHLTDEIGEQSFVCFTVCKRDRNSPSAPSPPQSLFARGLLATKQALIPSETTLQFQVFVEGCGPVTESQLARYQSLLIDATQRLYLPVSQTVWSNNPN